MILDCSSRSEITEPYRKRIAYDPYITLSNPFISCMNESETTNNSGKDSNSRYLNDFEQLSVLGTGQFSVVYLCIRRLDGCKYAIKKIKKQIQTKAEQKIVLHDVFASSSLSYNNIFNIHIVKYYSCWQEESTLYIQYEACEYGQVNMTLYEKYNKNIPEKIILQILYQISDALSTLHNNGYVHLDIKPDNILISKIGNEEGENWLFKICDFGLMSKSDGSMNYNEGDSRYCSLEVMNEEKSNLCKSDIFSLGLSIYELCIGEDLPSAGNEWQQLREGNFTRKLKISPYLQILLKVFFYNYILFRK